MAERFDPERFLGAYAEAFAAGDPEAIARFYEAPSLTVRADGQLVVFGSPAEMTAFFGDVLEAYRAEGMASFSGCAVRMEALGRLSAELCCDWSMERADGGVIRRWRQTYIFRQSGGAWRIVTSILHREWRRSRVGCEMPRRAQPVSGRRPSCFPHRRRRRAAR